MFGHKTAQAKLVEEQALKQDVDMFLQSCYDENQFTPDIFRLNRREGHRLFIYDDLMRTHRNRQVFEDATCPIQFRAVGYTEQPFQLWKKKLGTVSFPIALFQSPCLGAEAKVRGELSSVTLSQLLELDKRYENGVQFQRVRINVQVPARQRAFLHNRLELTGADGEPYFVSEVFLKRVYEFSAWAYVGLHDYWVSQLNSSIIETNPSENRTKIIIRNTGKNQMFKPVRMRKPHEGQLYYYFSHQEYDD